MSRESTRDRLAARPVLWGAGLIALTAALYAPGLPAGFVGDDFMLLHRLRALAGAGDVLRFFQAEFFEYYRPLGFVSHALDWWVSGADPRQFHATNLLLHLVNVTLILAIGWTLAPRTAAGPIAAGLFGLHAASHEPVMWISARFDLLATAWSLAALLLILHGRHLLAVSAFLLALLSKESTVALPLTAAAWAVFGLRRDRRSTLLFVAPWLGALAVYALARELGGGVSPMGGSGRLPKLAALGCGLAALVWLAGRPWAVAAAWVRGHITPIVTLLLALLAAAAAIVLVSTGAVARLVAEKLAVAGFVLANLLSPVAVHSVAPFYLDPSSIWSSLGGLILVAGLLLLSPAILRRAPEDARLLFLLLFLASALLPISALTEGTRYLYLPLAAASLFTGVLLAHLPAPRRRTAVAALALFLAVSAAQVALKVRDWSWAGSMTAEGARLVDSALAPSCGEGHVVFLTSPVGVRGVYTHFYYETFELARGCQPETFHVLVRMREDRAVDIRREGPRSLVITTTAGHRPMLLSQDLRTFDVLLSDGPARELETPLGTVRAERIGDAEHVTLTLAEKLDVDDLHLFYYSEGQIRRLPR